MSSRIERAIAEIHAIDDLSKANRWVNHIHPSVKLFITLLFIVLTVSFDKYDLSGLLGMCVYPAVLFVAGELEFRSALRRLAVVLPFVCAVGILNPLFDRHTVLTLGGLAVSGGTLSMLSLMLKAVLTVFSAYILIATTSIEQICASLRRAHVPRSIVVTVLLIYRYIVVLLKEADRVMKAYALRAPGQKGVQYRAWGPLAGRMLLRSMDRAQELYRSMLLRGFDGDFHWAEAGRPDRASLVFLAAWAVILPLLRYLPPAETVGKLLVR